MAGEVAFGGVAHVVNFSDRRVVAHEASFGIPRCRYVGNVGIHVDVTSFRVVSIVPEHDDREHGLRVSVVGVGIQIDVSAAYDDRLLSGNSHLPVSGSRARGLSFERKDATLVSVDRGRGEFRKVVVVEVFGEIGQRDGAIGTVVGRKGSRHRLHVLPDVGFELVFIHGLRIDGNSRLDGTHEVLAGIGDLPVRGEFLSVGLGRSESGGRHRGRYEIERHDSRRHVEVRGIVSGGADGGRTVGSVANRVVFEKPREISCEPDFSETDAMGIRPDGNGFRNGSSARHGAETAGKEERYLLQGSFGQGGIRTEIAPDGHVGEVSEIGVVMEVETVFRRRETAYGRVVLEGDAHVVPGAVHEVVPTFGRNDFEGRFEGEVPVDVRIGSEVGSERSSVAGVRVLSAAYETARAARSVRRGEGVGKLEHAHLDLVSRKVGVPLFGRYGATDLDGVSSVCAGVRSHVDLRSGVSGGARYPVPVVPIVPHGSVSGVAVRRRILVSEEGGVVGKRPVATNFENSRNRSDDVAVGVFEMDGVGIPVVEVGDHRAGQTRRSYRDVARDDRDGVRDDLDPLFLRGRVSGVVFDGDLDDRDTFAVVVGVAARVYVAGEVPEIVGCRRKVEKRGFDARFRNPGVRIVLEPGSGAVVGILRGIGVIRGGFQQDGGRIYVESRGSLVVRNRSGSRGAYVSRIVLRPDVNGFSPFGRVASVGGIGEVEGLRGTGSPGFPAGILIRGAA